LLLPQAILKVITAVAPGPAAITASYTKGGITKTDTVEVTVEGELSYWNSHLDQKQICRLLQ